MQAVEPATLTPALGRERATEMSLGQNRPQDGFGEEQKTLPKENQALFFFSLTVLQMWESGICEAKTDIWNLPALPIKQTEHTAMEVISCVEKMRLF